MARADFKKQLDAAVEQSRITLVQGLPRVGRSVAVKQWAGGRHDAAIQPFGSGNDLAAVMVFDHLRSYQVDDFVVHFRAAEAAQARTRYLVAAVDLITAEKIRDALAGSVLTLELATTSWPSSRSFPPQQVRPPGWQRCPSPQMPPSLTPTGIGCVAVCPKACRRIAMRRASLGAEA